MSYCAEILIIFLMINSYSASEARCGYNSCHSIKKGYVNVHVVPHTHDDMGWLKTVEQYYYGTKDGIQKTSVKNILSSVVRALKINKDRRFIYVETGFFWKWWIEQTAEVQSDVKELVNTGQLEFVGGGWSMNDEAVVDYLSTIDQFTLGLRKLNDTFGECGRPKVGWQIDPFGHSREMASIFAQMGYDGFLLNRIDYEDKDIKMANKSMEFVWRGSQSLGHSADTFTSVMFRHYSAPSDLCFDIALCNDDFIVDSPESVEYNINIKAENFIKNWVMPATKSYATSNILVPFGDDFMYQYADLYFENLDKLIKYTNNRTFDGIQYNVIYSSPSCYVKAVFDETKGKLNTATKSDDFFPYAATTNDYWTGYYSSRPTIKRYARFANNFAQIVKQLSFNKAFSKRQEEHLSKLEEALGIVQHHDAITGTEKEVVTHDYVKLLHDGITAAELVADASLRTLTNASNTGFYTCSLLNISQCSYSEAGENIVVTVYNPLSRNINKYIRLPITEWSFTVQDFAGNYLPTQVVPIHKSILKVPGRNSSATKELIFVASDLPGLGFKSYYLKRTSLKNKLKPRAFKKKTFLSPGGDATSWIYEFANDVNIGFNQSILYYNGTDAGSYTLKINTSQPEFRFTNVTTEFHEGDIVSEYHQTFSDWVSQVIRVYHQEKFVEFDYLVGPIPNDTMGREVISRFTTNLKTDSEFFTDANGRETLKRIRNYRPTWNTTKEPPSPEKNYYPITSKISMRDEENDVQLTVLTDRSQGATSLWDGEIELLVHRTCWGEGAYEKLFEEAFGVGVVTRGSHYLVVGGYKNASGEDGIHALEHDVAEKTFMNSWIFFSKPDSSFEDYQQNQIMNYSGLIHPLARNVRIATLSHWKDDALLLRLEHLFEKNEDSDLSVNITIDLKDLFAFCTITAVKETTLAANQWLKGSHRLNFTSILDDTVHEPNDDRKYEYGEFKVTLVPMQIRTFIIFVHYQ